MNLELSSYELEQMMHLPKNLKSVKKRIRAWRVFLRVVRIAFIPLIVSCFLIVIGYAVLFIGAVSALPDRWGDGGRPPLPPATPSIQNARTDCIRDVAFRIFNKSFSVHRPGDPRRPVSYLYQDCDVTILQEYDCNPYYVFYGRVQLSNPTTAQESTVQNDPDIPSSWETDFFLVNRFNPSEALRVRGKGNMYFPEHYDRIHWNFGYEHPLP